MEAKKRKVSTFKAEEVRWLDENRAFLEEHYAGMWVAVDGRRLVGVGKTMQEADDAAVANGAVDPLFDVVTAKEYQGRVFVR